MFEVAVVLHPAADGMGHKPTSDVLGWPPGYFENVAGSITDETFVAPPRGMP